jgi:hypothetical protein
VGSSVEPVLRAVAISAAALTLAVPSASGAGDGADVLFSSFGISVLRDDGTVFAQLPAGGESPASLSSEASWSPGGERIAHTVQHLVERPGGAFVAQEVHVARTDGGDDVRLTTDGGRDDASNTSPAWSPDGGLIAWLKVQPQVTALWTMRPDGTEQRELARFATSMTRPRWSPDGTRLMTVLGGPAVARITLVPRGGGASFALTPEGEGDLEPDWSPDGSRIAFVTAGRIAVMNADGTARRLVSTVAGRDPRWSPDGSSIAFTGLRTFGEPGGRFGPPVRNDLFVVAADGSGERRLTGPLGTEYGGTIPGGYAPVWWPDGARLMYGGRTTSTWTLNADGSCERPFAPDYVGQLRAPEWSPAATLVTQPARCADLRAQVAYETYAGLGGTRSVALTVDNDGNVNAAAIRVEVTAPTGGSVDVVPGGCTPGPSVSCVLPPLAAQRRTTVALTVRMPATAGQALATVSVVPEAPAPTRAVTLTLGFNVLPCSMVGTQANDAIRGTDGSDRICALTGADRIVGLGGDDFLDAGNGDDEIDGGPGRDTIVAKGGRDIVRARDGVRDDIDCGSERDIALVDRVDRLVSCDYAIANGLRCSRFGTGASETLVGTFRRDVLCALPGNDTVRGLQGDDTLDGGSGNDTLDGGAGRDLVLGGEGYDTVLSRDGERDRVRCGAQDDVVVADRRDVVAADCERVRRR